MTELKNDRYLRALLRQPVDVTPVWMMRQAGRYLPEYKATRAQAGDFMSLCKNAELACEVTLQPLRRYPLDAAILFSDILTVPDAMGLGLYFEAGEGPRFTSPVTCKADVDKLPIPDPEDELGYVMNAVRTIRRELKGEVPLIGFSGSPWTLATYMVEGGSSKAFTVIKKMMYADPQALHALLDKLAKSVTLYLNAQIKAGAQAVMIFDTWGGVLTGRDYQQFSLYYMHKIVDGLLRENDGRRVPVTLFTKGGGQWLEAMAESDAIDAVYIASPNSLHFSQTQLFLSHKIHVICEKPLASNLAEVDAAIACARENQVVLFEAFKTAYLPNFHLLRQALPKVGKLRKVFFNYCQYSSRYQRYLDGENPNTFNPTFSNGSIMDIGFYCLASAVALFGEPKSVQATASLLASGVDAHGVVVMDYGDFSVTLQHSKVSDSVLASEIQGEAGSLVIEKLSECQKVCFVPRGSQMQDLTQPQHINTMLYEAELFATLVDEHLVNHPGLAVSRITAKLLTEIRRQTGVIFPADNVKL